MKLLRYLALLSLAALMLPVAASARDKNQRSVDIPNLVQVGNTQLKPGTYKVEWQDAGPNAQVTFLHKNKKVATVPATIKTNDSQVTEDAVITDHANSKHPVLQEIDFSHGKDAVILSKTLSKGV